MARIYYLEPSHTNMNTPALREHMRRHHWRKYFLFRRLEAHAETEEQKRHARRMAQQHFELARSLQNTNEQLKTLRDCHL